MFSRWCAPLRWRDAGSREELACLLRAAFFGTTVVQLGGDQPVLDWSSYITPHLVSIEGHQGPHLFGFTRSATGASNMRTKNWARDATWAGDMHGNPLRHAMGGWAEGGGGFDEGRKGREGKGREKQKVKRVLVCFLVCS